MEGGRATLTEVSLRLASRVESFDAVGLRFVGRLRRRWLSPAVALYTRSGNLGILWIGLGATVDHPGRVMVIVATAALASEAVKQVTRRERPAIERLERMIGFQRTTSMPSGHAASAAAGAVVLSSYAPAYSALWAGLALLMALARVYVGVHYPSDVAVGAVLGVLLGLAAIGTFSAFF